MNLPESIKYRKKQDMVIREQSATIVCTHGRVCTVKLCKAIWEPKV